MAYVSNIINYMDFLFPEHLAEAWDNVGLLIGSENNTVNKALLTLDVDVDVAMEAVENDVDIIISHHPVIFNPIKSITEDTNDGKMLSLLLKNDISVFSAHTNLDVADGGLNDYAAKLLGINIEGALCENTGLGRFGKFDKEHTLFDVASLCKKVFKVENIRMVGNAGKIVTNVAIVTGSGMSEVGGCYEKNIDLFITGDVKYSGAREALANNLAVIDAGHYGTEFIVVDMLYEVLSNKFPEVEFIKSTTNTDIFDTI